MNLVYLGLGSNLKSPERQLRLALARLNTIPKTNVIQSSPIIKTSPWGGLKGQPNYYNCVASINTALSPETLLKYCHCIENRQGRVRKSKWGSRTLDIDILLFKGLKRNTMNLIIPHPFIMVRDFVRDPLSALMRKSTGDPRLKTLISPNMLALHDA